MPAIGPSQRDMPEGAAAAGAAAAGCDEGVDACEAVLPAGAAGAGAAFCGVMLRCAPKLPPPPMRRASATPFRVSVNAAMAANVMIALCFIGFSLHC